MQKVTLRIGNELYAEVVGEAAKADISLAEALRRRLGDYGDGMLTFYVHGGRTKQVPRGLMEKLWASSGPARKICFIRGLREAQTGLSLQESEEIVESYMASQARRES